MAAVGMNAADQGDYFTTSDGLRFQVTSLEPAVASLTSSQITGGYPGVVTIPAKVAYDGVDFAVTVPNEDHGFGDSTTGLIFAPDYTGSLNIYLGTLSNLTELKLPRDIRAGAEPQLTLAPQLMDAGIDQYGGNYVIKLHKFVVRNADGETIRPYLHSHTDGVPNIALDADNRFVVPQNDEYSYFTFKTASRYDFNLGYDMPSGYLLMLASASVDNPGTYYDDGKLVYGIAEERAMVKGLSPDNSNATSVTIPAEVTYGGKTLPVNRICSQAFYGLAADGYTVISDLAEIDLGAVEEISSVAFAYCKKLKYLYIPATVRSIEYDFLSGSGVERVDIDPDARIKALHTQAFNNSKLIYPYEMSVAGDVLKFRLKCKVFCNNEPLALYIGADGTTGSLSIYPDEDGFYSVNRYELANEVYSTLRFMADPAAVKCFSGSMATYWLTSDSWKVPTGPDHIYLIGDPTAWERPNDPTSSVLKSSAWKVPEEANSDFYSNYRLDRVDNMQDVYAGVFYLPPTEALHSGVEGNDYTTQFRFVTSLGGWADDVQLGAGYPDFYTIPIRLDYAGSAEAEGKSNWGVLVDETTPVTMVVYMAKSYNNVSFKQGVWDVEIVYYESNSYPTVVFISPEASAPSVEVEPGDADAPVEYFNLQGLRVSNPSAGLYIRRQGSRTSKVFVK